VQDHTPGGYQLYHPYMIERVGEIRRLQMEKRLTITEIRDAL
jgi:DNA-binding transcriptional MerR regulator